MSKEELENAIKIFKRICKEEGMFGNLKWYKEHEMFIRRQLDPLYYGLVYNMPLNFNRIGKEYSIQLKFIKELLDANLLDKKMHRDSIRNICSRYDTSNKSLFKYDKAAYDAWKTIEKESNKHEIRKYMIKKYMETYNEDPCIVQVFENNIIDNTQTLGQN